MIKWRRFDRGRYFGGAWWDIVQVGSSWELCTIGYNSYEEIGSLPTLVAAKQLAELLVENNPQAWQ